MMERKIHASRIADALRRPDSYAEAKGGAVACFKKYPEGMLKIVFRQIGFKGKGEYVIITLYYL